MKELTKIAFTLTLLILFVPVILYAQTWSQIQTSGNPTQRANSSAIYIESGNRIIVFGGRSAAGNLNDVWSLNLSTNAWLNITPASGQIPAARFSQNAFYDSLLNRMIIWSGQGVQLYNDVWAFNLNNNSWQNLWPDGNVSGAPLKRYGTAAVFDPLNRRIVNFAGFTTSGRFEDTWYFQVDSLRWTEKTNSFHPELRCLHTACISNDLQNMIVYGGQHNGSLDDTWSLNLNTFIWTNITPTFKPAGRWFTYAINTKLNNVVIFGGENSSGIFGDLWKFSLTANSWDSISQGILKPSARYGHTAIYVSSSDKMIIFGGYDNAFNNDTWQFTNISTTGINNISNIAESFQLFQNFPNPFNPKTIISYTIGTSQLAVGNNVSLIVYDMLGKEVSTLVNQKQNAGTYSVSFNGTNLPSGIYFYKLEILNDRSQKVFTDTKKMIVVK